MFLTVSTAQAAVGPDPGFKAELEAMARVTDVTLCRGRGFLIAGEFHRIGGVRHNHLALLDIHGVPIPGFHAAIDGDASVQSVVVQDDGRILVSGLFPRIAQSEQGGVIRLMADGAMDASFHFEGAVQDGFRLGRVALDPAGRIHLASYVGNKIEVLRLASDGRVETDRTFRVEAAVRFAGEPRPPRVHVLADERYYLTGDFEDVWYSPGQIPRFGHILRLRPDGTPDAAFDTFLGLSINGRPYGVGVHASALMPDGRLLAGGRFTHFNSHARPGIMVLHADGSLDLGFRPRDVDLAAVETVLPMPDGAIIAGGVFRIAGETGVRGLVRFLADGTLDRAFANIEGRPDIAQAVLAIASVSGDRIAVAGQGIGPGEAGPGAIALMQSDGRPTGDVPPVAVAPGYAGCITPAPDGTVYVAGNFQWVNGVRSQSLVRLLHDGSVDPTFRVASAGGYTGPMVLLPDGALLVRGDVGLGVPLLDKLDSMGNRFPGFSAAGISGSLSGILPREDGDILVWGQFDGSFPWQADPVPPVAGPLAVLMRDGTRRTNAIPVYSDISGTSALLALPDGGFLMAGGNGGVARFSSDYTRDMGWSVHMSDGQAVMLGGGVHAMAGDALGRILLGGSFLSVGSNAPMVLMRISMDGGLDTSFAAPLSGEFVRDIQVGPGGRLTILGSFMVGTPTPKPASVIRLMPDGSLDPDFPGVGPLTTSMALHGDDLYVSVIDQGTPAEPAGRLIRYNPRPTEPMLGWSWAPSTRGLRLDAVNPGGTIRWEMSRDLKVWTPVPGSSGTATLGWEVPADDPPLFFRALR